ncbi:hypothetical protein [Providencia rettgeri]|uniref:hypothetical protein n=1 Tax=Providencia rettgeri TaxID=587 RepID=UPI001419FFE7|nr:hypothetical protein [Providencia rettgeri]NIH04722.1 hypothetical protein [Providencia rettgeri]
MSQNESWGDDKFNYGYCDFENYWGETLSHVELTHFVAGYFDVTKKLATSIKLYDIPDKSELKKVFAILFERNKIDSYDFWSIKFMTKKGEVYKTKEPLRCTISIDDSEYVILGINGDKKTFYIAFSTMIGCNKKLVKVE